MERKEFIDALLARAQQEGFEACEVYYAAESSFETSVFKGEILNYSVADSMGLSFRALIGGKMGYAATQVLDEDAIDLLIEAARTNAGLIESEDQQFIFAGSEEYTAVESYYPALEAITAAEKIDMAKRLEQAALAADPRIDQVEGCEIVSSSFERMIVNSKGLNVAHRANLLGGYVAPVARDGERVNTSFEVFFGNDAKQIDLEATAKQAVADAVAGLEAGSVDSGEYRVCLSNKAATSLLATFSGIFSADSAQKGLSLLKGREGEVIAAECVTLVDDPHMVGSGASTPFDAEGVATRKKRVIDGGRLTTLLHNLKTAHKDGVQTTANAAKGGYSAPVGIAPTNFYFLPGEGTLDDSLAAVGDGLLITNLQGLHAGANPISGDFSLGAKGYLVEGGKIVRAVDQITVAGNFYTVLKDVERVGGDLRMGMPGGSCFGSPSLVVKKLSVAGK